jgi:hypothetical protein
MSSPTVVYPLSINPNIIDKPDGTTGAGLGKGWEPFELSQHDFAASILRGRPLAPEYRGGHRKTANFMCAGFLAADVDRGLTLEDARDHAFVRHHAALIHTTASHTPENNRFRIVFLLDETITSARDWTDAQLGLALTLESDRSVTDGARLFFGNRRAVVYHIGKTVPPKVVFDLIARGRDARASRSPGGGLLPVNSVRRIAGPELIKIAGGQTVRFDEMCVGVRVHCPHHDDTDPSAFTVRSRVGPMGIHCSACKVTFWPAGERDGYDFNAFDRLFEELAAGEQQVDAEAVGFDAFFPPAPRFERHQSLYLPTLVYEPGITLVKSPKGSGKTEALRVMLDEIRAGRFRGDIAQKDRPKSVLLIGHRQSLIREAAAKLGLRCYLDTDEETDGKMRTLAVCLDSLPKYNESSFTQLSGRSPIYRRNLPYDLIIIDESEQVLPHLLSETIKSRLGVDRCFDALMHEVANAKAVIALDADLGLVTAHGLRTMRPQDWASRCRIVYNAPIVPVQKRVMRLHRSMNFLVEQMIDAIKRGEHCFVVSNSKKFIDTTHRMILNECGEGIVMRVVTSDNSRDEATLKFLANIKTEILKVQVVLASPSIGTGIDITFLNGKCRVDRVFGFFYPFVNTHTDIDQQLARVRNPGAIDIWISPATFDFTCNIEVIMDDLARAYTVGRAVRGRRADGMVEYNRDDPLLMICAHVTALQRASKNRLVELFRKLREANGWAVEWVDETALPGPYGPARKMLDDERMEMLLNAETLSDADYIELDEKVSKGASLTKEERIAYERNSFERTVGVPLDAGLVAMNLDGRLLERITTLAEIFWIWSKDHPDGLIDALLAPTLNPNGRLQRMEPARLITVLMRVAGLTDVHGFDADTLASVDSLARFVAICRENRTVIEETFGEPLRADFGEKPVGQLNRFLRRIGLKLERAKTRKGVGGRKIRYYAIPTDMLETMTRLARSFLEVRERNEVEKERARLEGWNRRRPAEKTVGDDVVSTDDIGLFSSSILGGSQ